VLHLPADPRAAGDGGTKMRGRFQPFPAISSEITNGTEMSSQITYDDFAKVEIRIGRIIEVEPFPRARNPSYKVKVEFGDAGTRWSSAQITSYAPEELMGRLVACVVNMPPRNIAGFQSEVLVLGARNDKGDVIVLSPTGDVVLGGQVF
jgi:tRNA-binding protein